MRRCTRHYSRCPEGGCDASSDISSCAHLADYTVWNVADEGRRLLEEGCRLNNINDYQLPRDRKGVSGETAGQRADEWKDEGEKGLTGHRRRKWKE